MRQVSIAFVLTISLAPATLRAQTHVVKKPQSVVRAVGVYEWTGDETKPSASRLVPVSIYIDNKLEDAGIYLARPVPFALDMGTIFEVQKSGAAQGTIDIAYQRHLEGNATAFDGGWTGYGPLKLKAKEPEVALARSGPLPQVVVSGGKGPHFSNQPPDPGAPKDPAKASPDRTGAAGAGSTVSADPPPVQDGERPAMRRRTDSGTDSAADDPERPTLKKRSPAQGKAAQKQRDQASVASVGPLNDDPDRPTLHRGNAGVIDAESLPPLNGIPLGMQQMVAVSDASDREEHAFARGWESDAERGEILRKLRALAATQLDRYAGSAAASAVVPAIRQPPKSLAGKRKSAKLPGVAAPPPPAFNAENVRGFTLSYGGAATYVYQASSPGPAGVVRYVLLVAQQEPAGELKLGLSSVTDSAHLDRTPWMRLVDAVDAEASNRASLLFELRGEKTRQFALYRVIGARAEQTFATGSPE